MDAPKEYVDLASSDNNDDDDASEDEADEVEDPRESPWPRNIDDRVNAAENVFGSEIIDLSNVPDVDVPPSVGVPVSGPAGEDEDEAPQLITKEVCLQMLLNVFPDISIKYVIEMIKERTRDDTRTASACERLVSDLLDGDPYPREREERAKRKRKREEDNSRDEFSDYKRDEQSRELPGYGQDAENILKDEYLDVPVQHIKSVLHRYKTLFKAYIVLEEQVRTYRNRSGPFRKLIKPRNHRAAETELIKRGSQLPKELKAAKNKIEISAFKRHRKEEIEKAEQENRAQAEMNNEMGECMCCFDDVPLNRMTSCNGNTIHFVCLSCAKKYIEGEIGNSRCRPVCFADTQCDGTFTRRQLQQILDDKSFERLEHLQQQQDIMAAGLDCLSECPFCDFKAECPPIEEDKEFRCHNPKCEKTSCRICQRETHIPLSCDEAKKDEKLSIRHIVEEAMSAALIRHCNKCKQPFVKDIGCNKMVCPHCKNVQCYVCSKNIRDYDHFSEVGNRPTNDKKCPIYDNVDLRHEEEVKKAANEAMAKARKENPGLSDQDLMVQVSDRVKQAENERQAAVYAREMHIPIQMANAMLARRPQLGAPAQRPIDPHGAPPPMPQLPYVPPHQYMPQNQYAPQLHYAPIPAPGFVPQLQNFNQFQQQARGLELQAYLPHLLQRRHIQQPRPYPANLPVGFPGPGAPAVNPPHHALPEGNPPPHPMALFDRRFQFGDYPRNIYPGAPNPQVVAQRYYQQLGPQDGHVQGQPQPGPQRGYAQGQQGQQEEQAQQGTQHERDHGRAARRAR